MKNTYTVFHKAKHYGFTLLEVMIAASVLAIACFGILRMLLTAQDNNAISASRSDAIIIAERFQSAMENEARIAQKSDANPPVIKLDDNNKTVLSYVLNPMNTKKWVCLGRVNSLGIDGSGNANVMVQNEPNKYCVGLYNREVRNHILYTGAIRIYWRKDNHPLDATECLDEVFGTLDTLSDANVDDHNKYAFISIPYSVMPGSTNRLPQVIGGGGGGSGGSGHGP